MKLRQAAFIAVCTILFTTVTPAHAQFEDPHFTRPQQAGQGPMSPWPSQQPRQEQMPPCVQEFTKLREATEKRGVAIRQAAQHKVSPQEACALFNAFTAAEEKMLKYAVDNGVWCGIPPQIVDSIKKGHAKSTEMRTNICRVAAAPVRSAAPTLSDALSSPIPDSNNIRTGSGTFDTLTGPPLGR